jgi:hypothetical protein
MTSFITVNCCQSFEPTLKIGTRTSSEILTFIGADAVVCLCVCVCVCVRYLQDVNETRRKLRLACHGERLVAYVQKTK